MNADTNLSIFIITDVAKHVYTAMERRINSPDENHLKPEEAHALFLIELMGGTSQIELAEQMNADPTAVADYVDTLSERGLVEHASDPADHTVQQIFPSEKRGEILPRMIQYIREIEATACDGLGPREHATLVRLLKTLRSNMRTFNASGSA